MNRWNWGMIIGYVGVGQCVLAAVGYAVAKDSRRMLYYIFAAAITLTVVWPAAPK